MVRRRLGAKGCARLKPTESTSGPERQAAVRALGLGCAGASSPYPPPTKVGTSAFIREPFPSWPLSPRPQQ